MFCRRSWHLIFLGLSACICTSGFALPAGMQVVLGEAQQKALSQSSVEIKTSDKAILNWGDFSIGAKELARFVQPGKHSVVLNRVVSGAPSQILGTLEANGKVYLINPNGIFVGKEGVINVASFVASTLDILEGSPLSGGELLFQGNKAAKIVNLGRITAWDGDVIMLSCAIENQGSVEAPHGTVGMGVGHQILLKPEGEERLFIRMPVEESDEETGIDQKGTIVAATAELKSKGNPYGFAIRHQGVIEATGVKEEGGRVFLVAEEGTSDVAGRIAAKTADHTGGEIRVLGDEVTIEEPAYLDVSEESGGGRILLGGDFRGSNPQVINAKRTIVMPGATLVGDALLQGDGGRVYVWSEEATGFYGTVSVQGGPSGGNGGVVAILGDQYFDFRGQANRLAPSGSAGTLILDPTSITIADTADVNTPRLSPFYPKQSYPSSVLGKATLLEALQEGDVIVQSAGGAGSEPGDVILNTPLLYASDYSLTLRSFVPGVQEGDVQVNYGIENTGGGAVILDSSRDINIGAQIKTKGYEGITLTGGRDVRVCGPVIAEGALNISATEDVDILAPLKGKQGISISSSGNIDVTAPMESLAGGVNINAGSEVHLLASVETQGAGGIKVSGDGNVFVGSIEGVLPSSIRSDRGTIQLSSTHGDVKISGGQTEGSFVNISTLAAPIHINAPGSGRMIQISGGSAAGAFAKVSSQRGAISLWSGGDLSLTSGMASCPDVQASIVSEKGNIRLRSVHDLTLLGGGEGSFSNPAFISSDSGMINVTSDYARILGGKGDGSGAYLFSGTKGITINAHDLLLKGGCGQKSNAQVVSSTGKVNIHTAGDLHLQGGAGVLSYAQVAAHQGQVSINGVGGDLILEGGSADKAYAQIGTGYYESTTPVLSNIFLSSLQGNIYLTGGVDSLAYAQIGHAPFGAQQTPAVSGLIHFPEEGSMGSLYLKGGSGVEASALIGMGNALCPNLGAEGELFVSVYGADGIQAASSSSALAGIVSGDVLRLLTPKRVEIAGGVIAAKGDLRIACDTVTLESPQSSTTHAQIISHEGDLHIEASKAQFGVETMEQSTHCSAPRGNIFLHTRETLCVQGGGEAEALSEIVAGKGAIVRSDGQIVIRGGSGMSADATIASAFGTVNLNSTHDLILKGGDDSHASVVNYGGGGGDLTAVSMRNVVLGQNSFFENYGSGELNAFADRDLTLAANAYFHTAGRGVLATAAGRDMILQDQAWMGHSGTGNLFIVSGRHTKMTDQFYAKTESGALNVVVDHFLPGHPVIGDGSFLKGEEVSLRTESGRVAIYTARREQNTVEGTINGEVFNPGAPYQNNNHEYWGVFFSEQVKTALDFYWASLRSDADPRILLASSSSLESPAFVIYYKDLLRSTPRAQLPSIKTSSTEWKAALSKSNRIARVEAEALRDISTYNEFLFVPIRFLMGYDGCYLSLPDHSFGLDSSFNIMLDECETLLRPKVRTYNTKKLSLDLELEDGEDLR